MYLKKRLTRKLCEGTGERGSEIPFRKLVFFVSSVIILSRCAVGRFCYHSSVITPTPLSAITIAHHTTSVETVKRRQRSVEIFL